jgi:hypothetical protein
MSHRLALVLLCVGTASVHAQIIGNQLTCATNVSVTPTLRAEGYSERTGDIALTCSGGTPTAAGFPVPTINIQIFLNTAVTSRLYTGAKSEALLLIDEPDSGLTGAPPSLFCADPNGLCAITGTGTGAGTYNGTAGRPNIFQGTVSGNSVSFSGIPLDAPGTGHTRVLRFTNIRVNASALGPGQTILPAPVIASVSISGATSLLLTNPFPTIGFIQSGQTFSVRSVDNQSAGSGLSVGRCASLTAPVRAGVLRFAENFGTAFLTRTWAPFVDSDSSPAPAPQNIPGMIYNTESNFYAPALTGSPDLATIGLASQGTRFRATIVNIPTGAAVYVSTTPVVFTGGVPAVATQGLAARLIANEATAFAPLAPTGTLEGVPVVQLLVTNGVANAVWEVLRTNPNAVDTADFAVWALPGSADGTVAVNGSLAPAPFSFTPSEGAAASATLPLPRFVAATNPADNLVNITACTVTITTPAALPDGISGTTYNQTIATTGGNPPVTFAITGGVPPTNLQLSTAGVLNGNPSPAGFYSFDVTATDSGGLHDTRTFSLRLWAVAAPVLSITKTHTGNFSQNQFGAAYTITVSNAPSVDPVEGTVTVTDVAPAGLSLVSMTGAGWLCSLNTCTRNDALAPGSSYPPITALVNVAANAAASLTNQATVSRNGSVAATASDPTTIQPAYSDTSAGDYFFNAVNLMREYGITAGCSVSPPMYCPNDNVTRAQMAIFIVRSVMGGDAFTYSATPHFTDVGSGDFGFKWIQKMSELGITAGCGGGQYCPNDPVTRGQMSIFVIRARLGAASDSTFYYPSTPSFTDVAANHPYFKWIQRMKLDQITGGCGTGTAYCPDDAVTRGQMSIFIIRGAFNQLLPAGTPILLSAIGPLAAQGQTTVKTVTGANTNFVQGTTMIDAGPGVIVGTITVTSPTTLTVQLTIAANAASGPRTLVVATAAEQAVLPNGLSIP